MCDHEPLRMRDCERTHRSPRCATLSTDGDPHAVDSSAITKRFLLYHIVPLWLASGVADWACHRATNIERTTGAKESLMHLLMLAEASVPVIAALFLEITTPVAALMVLSFVLHEATALWDVSMPSRAGK